MTATQPATTWHDDITINGQPYPTRHPVPDHGPNSDAYLGTLTHAQRDHLRAIHEAAHAVAALAQGAHVHYAEIVTTSTLKNTALTATGTPSGNTAVCNIPDGQSFAIFLGVGERAEDHWLHQSNQWTPLLAAGVELGAYGDRQALLKVNPHIRFGIDHNDYTVVHDLADQFVTAQWDVITTVAAALVTRLHLTGGEIADLAQLPNGIHSRTCTLPTA
ncbi:hypothetical protein DMH12_38095 [Streptomyces sp. WAC 04229]|uniref:hypothetical protein n=1 Tax=Streptomyces sp. WAC 04229 TaxID=2203206 RepID=UPI000F74B58A|nr:hypothetical protein [Streptomyces sp. WAC 04229]RSN38337.1 hypothetical protein DMH12_38095 [Streptomyces sp. WAC 04229]